MKIFCDKKNYNILKVLIAGELTDTAITIEEIKGHKVSFNSHFLFNNNDGLNLSLPVASAAYLCRKKNLRNFEAEQMLEWNNSVLKPSLASFISLMYTKDKSEDVPPGLKSYLLYLDDKLKKKKYLSNDALSIADIDIWSEFYPVLADKDLFRAKISSFANIVHWFDNLWEEKAFKNACNKFDGGYGPCFCKDFIKNMKVPLCSVDVKSVITDSEKKPTLNEELKVTEEEILSAYKVWCNGNKNNSIPRERHHPILPKQNERNILITSALPYVNNVPHLGNIIGCVLSADVYSRFCRLRNYNVVYFCGTDEYGTATETKALEEGVTPQQICDKYHKIHREIYQWFNIDFDHFGRTTTNKQTEIAQDIFWKLHKNNYLSEDTVEQLLCQQCNRFLADRFVTGGCPYCMYEDARGDQCDKCSKLINAVELKNPKCKVCSSAPVVKSSKHLFLNLPKVQSNLSSWFDESIAENNWTNSARVITKSWIKEGLKPRCITRDLKWGTPVPLDGFKDKVFYVWFDAPIGYLSISASYSDQWEKWWKNPKEVELYQFMAKDNVPFHGVIFPATQMGANDNFTIINNLIATEYLNYEDGKFSKSRGVGVFGTDAKDTGIPADIWRFYLLFIRPENQDSAFSWSDLMTKNNTELLNNLGNFINRSLTFLYNNFGTVPEMTLNKDDKIILVQITRDLQQYINLLEKVREKDAIKHILNISRLGNQLMQSSKPWDLMKGCQEQKSRAGTVIGICCNIACLLSVMLQPYMPTISATIQSQLNAPKECNVLSPKFIMYLPPGHKINKPSPLFKKIEQKQVDELRQKFIGASSGSSSQKPEAIEKAIPNSAEIEKLNAAILEQGNKVRELKASKAEKSVIGEQVKLLLSLKAQLTNAGPEVEKNKPNSAEIEKLNAAVAEQGNKVRELKASKAEKSVIDEHVKLLLSLKAQLTSAGGEVASSDKSSKSKKKKSGK